MGENLYIKIPTYKIKCLLIFGHRIRISLRIPSGCIIFYHLCPVLYTEQKARKCNKQTNEKALFDIYNISNLTINQELIVTVQVILQFT